MAYKPKLLDPTAGGTGINNGTNTITLGGNLTTSGAFASTFTMTNTTSVTFPTSGTLATTAAIPSLPLSLSNGGTAASLTASNGGILYSGSSALAVLAGTATAGQILRSGSSAAPAWSTATYPATTTSQQVLYSSSANVVAGLTTNTNSVLVADGSGNISMNGTVTAWTPVLQFGGASVGITYNAQSGNWYKIGRIIFFDCYLDISSKGSSTGSATITGLTAPNNPALLGITNFTANNLTFTGQCNARIPAGTTTISLDQFASGGARTQLDDTSFTAGTYVQISGSYII